MAVDLAALGGTWRRRSYIYTGHRHRILQVQSADSRRSEAPIRSKGLLRRFGSIALKQLLRGKNRSTREGEEQLHNLQGAGPMKALLPLSSSSGSS